MNKKGFTLMELMVVVLIIAILTAIAVPIYQNAVDAQHNARAKAILETVNGGLERFNREYPNVRIITGTDDNNRPITVTNPPAGTICTYNGQRVVAQAQTSNQISLQDFIGQLIICGYIPRYNYGSNIKTANDASLDYRFILQDPEHGAVCGLGYAYMEPKPDADNEVKVGTKFCRPVNNGNNTAVCSYKACIDARGKAVDPYTH